MNWGEIAKKPASVIILSSLLVFLSPWPVFFLARQGYFSTQSTSFLFALAINDLLLLFVLPLLLIRRVFHKKPADVGLVLPTNLPSAVKLTLTTIVVFLPVVFFLSKQASFKEYYAVKEGFLVVLVPSILSGSIYYFAEEFIFRGVLFFCLWDRLKWHGVWIINVVFALFHLQKPLPEVFFAFFLGMSLSYLSYRTKSFIPAVFVHLILAVTLNILVLI